jgi:hypothetical protein
MSEGIPPEVIQTPGGFSVRYLDSWLYSRKEPRALPEKSALSFSLPPRSLILACSPLLGYGLEILLSRLPSDCGLLCLETDPLLYRLSLDSLPAAVTDDPRFIYRLARKGADLVGSVPRIREYRRVLSLPLSGGYALNQQLYAALHDCLRDEISVLWRNKATLNRFGRMWVRNLIDNLPALAASKGLSELAARVGNRAVLVAGAGPSLEGTLAWLPPRRGEFFVLAVDTALQAFLSAGMRPDALVCLEGQAHNLKDFIGAAGSRIPLVADSIAHPDSFRVLGGDIYAVSSSFADCALLRRMEDSGLLPAPLPPLGSVGVAALWIGLRLNGDATPLYLTGLDFSYPLGKIHARGTPSHKSLLAGMTRLSRDPWVESSLRDGVLKAASIDGRTLITDPVMASYAQLARSELRAAKAPVIDMRGSGLDLGIQPLPVQDEPPEHPGGAPHPGADSAPGGSEGGEAEPDAERARRFADFALAEEARAAELKSLLSGERRMDEPRLRELLGECDYLYLHFADQEGSESFTESALRRISVEARSAVCRWRAAAVRLERRAKPS